MPISAPAEPPGARVHRQQVVQRAHRPRAPRVRGGREPVVHRVHRVDVHRVVVGVGEERSGVELYARRSRRAAHEHVAGVETPAEGKASGVRLRHAGGHLEAHEFFRGVPSQRLRGPGEDRAERVPTLKRALGGDQHRQAKTFSFRRFFVFRFVANLHRPYDPRDVSYDARTRWLCRLRASDGVGRLPRLAERSFANERVLVLRKSFGTEKASRFRERRLELDLRRERGERPGDARRRRGTSDRGGHLVSRSRLVAIEKDSRKSFRNALVAFSVGARAETTDTTFFAVNLPRAVWGARLGRALDAELGEVGGEARGCVGGAPRA